MKTQLLKNKNIVVIGGAGRIGKAFVKAIGENGGRVVVADLAVNEEKKVTPLQTNTKSGKSEGMRVDITKIDSINKLISQLKRRYEKIDAVVNCAYPRNKKYGQKLENVTYKNFCENVNLHLGGYFLVAQQFCKAFKVQGYGNLIFIGSIYGTVSPRFDIYKGTSMTMPVEYAAIKSAVVHLTRYFAMYFKGTGIRVNCLSPGGILQNQPLSFLKAYNAHCASKGMLSADDLVGSLIFLLSEESRYMNGQNLIVDDGFSI